MRALLATGSPEEPLRVGEVSVPEPGRGEVLIEVAAASINRGETFLLEAPPARWRPGKDVAGTLVALGPGVDRLRVGQRVVAHPEQGGWAEKVAVPAGRVAPLPDSIADDLAASLPLAGLTALRLTRVTGPLATRRLLLTGASGGVGHFFTELAAAQGALVTAVSASAERGARLLDLGATEIVPSVAAAEGPFDIAVESIGGDSLPIAFAKLRVDGLLVWLGQASRTPPTLDFFDWRGATSGAIRRFHYEEGQTPMDDDLATLVRLTAAGRLHPEIGLRRSWTEANRLVSEVVRRQVRGNAVLLPS